MQISSTLAENALSAVFAPSKRAHLDVKKPDAGNAGDKPTVSLSDQPGPAPTQAARDLTPADLLGGDVLAAEDGSQLTLTLEGLMEAWGKTDTPYDLNTDGTVDVRDMLQLLNAGGSLTIDSPQTEETQLTLRGLIDAWGQSDSPYDLNTDGTVDVADLMQMLSDMTGEDVTALDPNNATGAIQELFNRWGQGDAQFDLTGDGTVDIFDALALLEKFGSGQSAPLAQSSPTSPTAPQAISSDTPPAAAEPALSATQPNEPSLKQLHQFTNGLLARLSEAGFTDKPPANLHSFLDQLNLNTNHKQMVLQRLLRQFPDGLGIDTRG